MTSSNLITDNQQVSTLLRDFHNALRDSPIIRISKFQRIGSLLSILNRLTKVEGGNAALEEHHAETYLFEREGFNAETSRALASSSTILKARFDIVWNHISDYDKALALWLDYDSNYNYWPYWDIYARALLPHIQLHSGTPESIIGAAAPTLPSHIYKKVRPREIESIRKKTSAKPDADITSYVSEQHNFIEFSCTKQYLPTSQQIALILELLDEYPEDKSNLADADRLLRKLGLSNDLVLKLLSLQRWPDRFRTMWARMTDQNRADLVTEDWEFYYNFWPGLEIYGQTLCPYIHLPSGKVSDLAYRPPSQ